MKEKILLIDGSSYLFRAYHTPALKDLTTPDGKYSGTVFGFNRTLNMLLDYFKPSHCCIVFDPRGKTKRNFIFPSYKANRPPTPPDIVEAYKNIEELLVKRKLKVTQVPEQEADDVLGSLAQKIADKNKEVLIATGDKDLAQLVTPNIKLVNINSKGIIVIDEKEVKANFGVLPNQIAEYLALTGDAVDNIPGMPGVGAKRAVQLLEKYKDLETLTKNHLEIAGKLGESIAQNIEHLPLYLKLTTINKNIELELVLSDLLIKTVEEEDFQYLIEYYEKMGFYGEIKNIKQDQNKTTNSKQPEPKPRNQDVIEVLSIDDWRLKAKELVNKTEDKTAYILIQNKQLILANSQLQFVATDTGADRNLTKKLEEIPADLITFDWKELGRSLQLTKIPDNASDILLKSYTINAGKLNHQWDKLKKLVFGVDAVEKAEENITSILEQYQKLDQHFSKELETEDRLNNIYSDLEKPLANVLYLIEQTGVLVNPIELVEIDNQLSKKIVEIKQTIFEKAEEPFNLDSPGQVGTILYEKMNIPVLKKTPTGNASTNEESLQQLVDKGYTIAEDILKYRGYAKLQATYTRGLQKHIDKENRIHTTLNQVVTSTGRLSSKNPNLQNIPIKSKLGRAIRQVFVAPKGYKILAADYSQIELRILAHESKDEGLLKAFKNGLDIHKITATKVFSVAEDEVTETQRRYAKTINFGLIYGMSAFSLAKQLNTRLDEAKEWTSKYFAQFPKIKTYMEESIVNAKDQGWVNTFMGRRIHIPDINSKNHLLKNYAERAAINAPIQGAAADIIKKAMVEIHQEIVNKKDIKMTLQIHDELLFEVQDEKVDFYKHLIKEKMEGVVLLNTPLTVNIGVAENWAKAH